MARKETLDKIIETIIDTKKSGKNHFNEIWKKSGYTKNTVSNALKELEKLGVIMKFKQEYGDKRFSYYSFVNDSEIAKHQVQKLLQTRKHNHISNEKLEEWMRNSIILMLRTSPKEITKLLEIEEYNSDDMKIIEAVTLEHMKLIILDILGIEILYSNNIPKDFYEMEIKKEEINPKEDLYDFKGEKIGDSDIILRSPDVFEAITSMIRLGMRIQKEIEAFDKSFQFIFRYSPKHKQRKEYVRDRVIKDVLKYKGLIGEDFSISEILAISKNENELIARTDDIMEKVFEKFYIIMARILKEMKSVAHYL